MCGISGLNWKNKEMINRMNASLKHRGPDGEGIYLDENISMGHRRLSIIDLTEKAHQPMFNDDRTLVIIYNGEVYNYKEIREELKKLGHSFFSTSDTEVVLKAYEEWREKCLSKFNGMFAFCIYNTNEKKMFIARDRFGIKPFYYYKKDDKFIFASEIRAILCHPIKRTPNDKLIYDYLMYNIVDHTDETFFKGIMKLPKAHYGIYDLETNELTLVKYWDIRRYNEEGNLDYEKAVKKFKEIFKESVRIRLRSDVPVGSCFSGGLDSSSIVSLIAKLLQNGNNISTFSAVYPGFEKDESYYIDKQVERLGIKNKKINPTAEDLKSDIEDYIYYQEEPTRSTSQYSQYCVMKLANKNNYKVLLDGQGSDEMLAGYHYFYGFYFKGLLKDLDIRKFLMEVYNLIKEGEWKIGVYSLFFLFTPKAIQKYYFRRKSNINKIFHKSIGTEYIKNYYSCSNLKEALAFHVNYKLEHLLKWEDRNSMAFSIETRVPFLDYRLVEFVLSLPSNYIIRNGKTKAILRDAMNEYVDKQVLGRTDKIGFETPEDKWLREEPIREFVKEITNSESFKNRKYFDVEKIRHDLKLHISGKKNIGMKIWQCVFLELWLRTFINRGNQQ